MKGFYKILNEKRLELGNKCPYRILSTIINPNHPKVRELEKQNYSILIINCSKYPKEILHEGCNPFFCKIIDEKIDLQDICRKCQKNKTTRSHIIDWDNYQSKSISLCEKCYEEEILGNFFFKQ